MKRWAVIVSQWSMGPEFELSRHWTRWGARRRERRVVFNEDEAVAFIRRIY